MKLEKLRLKKLERISPSRYSAIKKCYYRVLLANTYKRPLIPYPPNGHLGNIIHECIRLILTGQIKEEDFNNLWQDLIDKEEKKLTEIGFKIIVPLKDSVKKGYAIKNI
jgi:hypothetical protein